MQRIDTATKAVDLFGAGKHGFKDGNQGLGIAPTDLNAAIFNALQEEICNVIEGQGLTLDSGSRTQLDTAIKTLIGKFTITTGGAAPSFTLTPSPPIAAYSAGQRHRVKFHVSGTTGSNTLNISGLGVKNLKQYDAAGAKAAAMVVANQITDIEYDGTDLVILDSLMVDFARKPTSANDYQPLPSGVILQWGNATCDVNGTAVISFPTTFPVACRAAFAIDIETAAASIGYGACSYTASGMTIQFAKGGAAFAAGPVSWFSIGI